MVIILVIILALKTIHLVRSIGVEYLTLNPESFVEFHSDNFWLNYGIHGPTK